MTGQAQASLRPQRVRDPQKILLVPLAAIPLGLLTRRVWRSPGATGPTTCWAAFSRRRSRSMRSQYIPRSVDGIQGTERVLLLDSPKAPRIAQSAVAVPPAAGSAQ
jgi:hypothetical protein